MSGRKFQVREDLFRLLLNEEEGVAYNLVPRVLADPESLTPEIRWCLLYLIRGVGYIASRNGVVSKNTNELKTCISRSVSYRRVYACFAMGG